MFQASPFPCLVHQVLRTNSFPTTVSVVTFIVASRMSRLKDGKFGKTTNRVNKCHFCEPLLSVTFIAVSSLCGRKSNTIL